MLPRTSLALLLPLAAIALLPGCGRQERIIEVTSTPTGALVWLNDAELGRTPVQAEFLHFGTYDVRLRLEGYEPIVTSREAHTPIHEFPPIDLIAAALPGDRVTRINWHFDLQPLAERVDPAAAERDLLDRARDFRTRSIPPAPAAPPAEPAPTEPPTPPAPAQP